MSQFNPYIAHNCRMGKYKYDFWITDEIAGQWYGGEDHNMPEKSWCLAHIRDGMKIADCGAHHGQLSVVFSKAVGAKGAVGAWEALPENAKVLQKNLDLNHCTNVIIRPYALGNENKRVTFSWAKHSNAIVAHDEHQRERAIDKEGAEREIACVRLDDDVPKDIRIDFIKLDVEGSDLEVLQGARRVLASRPILDLEIHNLLFENRRETLQQIFNILEPLQYAYSVLPDPSSAIEPVGWKIDLAELARFDNPHVFCLPIWRPGPAATAQRRRFWAGWPRSA